MQLLALSAQLPQAVRRRLGVRYPRLAQAYLSYRLSREMQRNTMRRTPFGFLFAGHAAMQAGEFEPDEVRLLQEYLPDADVYVDVGANVGFFVCLAARLGKHVLAVEPMAHNLDFLFANAHANGFEDVEVFPVALGERPGLATMFGGGTGASLIGRWAGAPEFWRHTVPVSTLDVLLGSRFAGQKLFIKVDIEGSEHALLLGATRTLARSPAPTWLLEVCFSENHPDGRNPHFRQVFELFWQRGYEARVADASERAVTPADVARWCEQGARDFGYVNYLFSRPDQGSHGDHA